MSQSQTLENFNYGFVYVFHWPEGDQRHEMLYSQPYETFKSGKSDTVRRPRPVGTDVLFAGTNVFYHKTFNKVQQVVHVERDPYGDWEFQSHYPLSGQYDWGNAAQTALQSIHSGQDGWATELRNKIQGVTINLAQHFAERKQTENLFLDFGKRVVASARALRRGRPQDVYDAITGGKQLPKNWRRGFSPEARQRATDNWLAFQFGVRPLVSDMSSSIEAYYKARRAKPIIKAFRVSPKGWRGHDSTVQYGPVNPTRYECEATSTKRVVCYAELDDDTGLWSVSSQLGLTNPALLLWELIPFSFIVDYAINVGDFLEASGTIKGVKRVSINVTDTVVLDSIATDGVGTATWKQVIKTRDITGSLPLPVLKFKQDPFSGTQIVNTLAVLSAQFRGGESRYPSLKRK